MYSYRTAWAADEKPIFELYVRVMRDYVTEIWGWDQAWQEQSFAAHFDPAAVILVHRGRELVGYCQVDGCADDLTVRSIVIHPRHQRRGIGTRLIEAVIASGRLHSKDVVLEVFKMNPGARRLYQRLGFQIESETTVSEVMRLVSCPEKTRSLSAAGKSRGGIAPT